MEIKKFNGFNNLNESNGSNIDNVVINDSINLLLKDLKGYVWNNVSRYDNDLSIKGQSYEFDISYNVVSEDEFNKLIEKFVRKGMGKYNISKIERVDGRALMLYFTFNNETYSIPLILTMSAGGMIYSNENDHRVKYGVWLNMNVCEKI